MPSVIFAALLWDALAGQFLSTSQTRMVGVLDDRYMRRLDCDSKNWTVFRQLLVSKMEAGALLGTDAELQQLAESWGTLCLLLQTDTLDHQELIQDFLATSSDD